MLSDYCNKYYEPMKERADRLVADDYSQARDMAFWKKRVRREWGHIEILSFVKPDNVKESLILGKEYTSELVASIGDLDPEDLGAEIILTEQNAKGEHHIVALYDFKLFSFKDGVATWRTTIVPEFSGAYESAGRLFARNPNMPHRQDLELVKWL